MRAQTASKLALLTAQFTGLILSALIVAVTFSNQEQVEQRLQKFAISKVQSATNDAWDAAKNNIDQPSRTQKLGALARRLSIKADNIDAHRKQIVSKLIANALSDRCKENCGFMLVAALAVDSAMVAKASKMRVGETTLKEFIVERYESTIQGLISDIRRFGMVNVITLSLMISLVIFRNYLNWRFSAFSVAVTAYTAWAVYSYIYRQDWTHTILFQNWAATGYQSTMIFVCCLFFDWLFLNGLITRTIANALGAALSSIQ